MHETHNRWAAGIATCFGLGKARFAGGTLATLAALPLHWAFTLLPEWLHVAGILFVCGIGAWSADKLCTSMAEKDPQSIVVDEAAGALVALWVAGNPDVLGVATAVLLFRALDILKPWPISLAENVRPPGLGTLSDDILAGVAAGGVVRMLALATGS